MRAVLPSLLTLCLLHGCETTKTGNPHVIEDGPAGFELVSSELEREQASALPAAERALFGKSNQDFAFALYAQVRNESPNLFYSPYSISTALAMTYGGAKGETKEEMASALHYDLPDERLHSAFNATQTTLNGRSTELVNAESKGEGFELNLTNALFGQKGVKFVPSYLDLLARHYGTGMYLADFATQPERERVAINDWVLERTKQRVPELLPEGSIPSDVALVLVNAIYFKASWLDKFDPARTKPAPFHAPTGDVTVPMMQGRAERYARLGDYQALELPYISPAARVLFILPDTGKLADVEARLDGALFAEARGALATHSVDLRFPRFRFDASLKLRAALEALGMKQAFAPGSADLSGISGAPGDLFIDQVYHKAFVAMDEDGTEAAAATAAVARAVSLPPPAEFILDRPFIFLIYDEPTEQILFVGRLSQPSP